MAQHIGGVSSQPEGGGVSCHPPVEGLTCAELLCKFPGEIEGNSSEVGISQKVIEVVAQQLKHQTQMVPEHKVTLQVDCRNTSTGECVCWCVCARVCARVLPVVPM